MSHWIEKTNIYHIYPLGFCGCEKYRSEATEHENGKILKIIDWIPHLKELNMNAVYFGPIFESFEHGYDTTDYYNIDKRLGTNEEFGKVCNELHKNGIRVILDGVFNHVGREHFAFKDLQKNGPNSRYKDWFSGLNFDGRSPYGDSFSYDGWNGCYNLVKLNLYNNDVVKHLFGAVKMWIEQWSIDGIRFDAADCLTDDFIRRIHNFTRELRPDFWLMGEIIHGQYNRWANSDMFDCVTNYQCYKGIYSSHNDRNYFEIAHSIDYQKNQYGNLYMYNFVDNHDVSRLMSVLKDSEMAECCYTMMYCMYGVPSVYYGSEFGIYGKKGQGADADVPIRPCLELKCIPDRNDTLMKHISTLGAIRLSSPAIQSGTYSSMELRNQTFSFKREKDGEEVYILLNISESDYTFRFNTKYSKLVDRLTGKTFNGGNAEICVGNNKSMILADKNSTIELSIPEASEANTPEIDYSLKAASKINNARGIGIPQGRTILIGGHYKHFSGGDYVVLNVAKNCETYEELVVYMQIYDKPTIWAMPLNTFLEDVDDNGSVKPRFALIND